MMRQRFILILVLAAGLAPSAGTAATFGEMSNGGPANGQGAMMPGYSAGPYATAPGMACPPWCAAPQGPTFGGPEGVLPGDPQAQPFIPALNADPRLGLPLGAYGDLPHTQLQLSTFGQVNSTTDPYNQWGLSTPFMFVPWSTPLTGWTNSQTWNWWRERSGALPRNW